MTSTVELVLKHLYAMIGGVCLGIALVHWYRQGLRNTQSDTRIWTVVVERYLVLLLIGIGIGVLAWIRRAG